MLDLLIVTLPPSYLHTPMPAPAFLKAAVEKHGFSCRTEDFPLLCFEKLFANDYKAYLQWIKIFRDEFDFAKCTKWQTDKLNQSIDLFVEFVEKTNPSFLGLSIFSYWQQRYAFLVCQKLKSINSSVQIVIGGMGCGVAADSLTTVTAMTFFDKKNNFGSYMIGKKLVDYVIFNDGELELVELLKAGADYQNHTRSNEVALNLAVLPNYDNYQLDKYLFINNEKLLTVQGSKGCVRQCVFCSEHRNYSRYYFKTGADIANEMISLSQRYGIRKFHFSDSLVNGSLPVFRDWVRRLAEYNTANPDQAIKWHGNYICRKNNDTTDDEYRLIKLSGAHGLTIGAESGSNRVLAEMKKQSTVEDLLYELEKFDKFGIDCTLLIMVGFYNETWQDFLATLSMLKKIQKYVFSSTVTTIKAGYTLVISDWTHYNQADFDIVSDNKFDWIYKQNPDLTLKERIRRRVILQEFCDDLRIPVGNANEDLSILENVMNNRADFKELSSAHN